MIFYCECFIAEAGAVYTFGWNGYGQLGLGHQISQDQPQKVTGLQQYNMKPTRVHCGGWNTLVQLEAEITTIECVTDVRMRTL